MENCKLDYVTLYSCHFYLHEPMRFLEQTRIVKLTNIITFGSEHMETGKEYVIMVLSLGQIAFNLQPRSVHFFSFIEQSCRDLSSADGYRPTIFI